MADVAQHAGILRPGEVGGERGRQASWSDGGGGEQVAQECEALTKSRQLVAREIAEFLGCAMDLNRKPRWSVQEAAAIIEMLTPWQCNAAIHEHDAHEIWQDDSIYCFYRGDVV